MQSRIRSHTRSKKLPAKGQRKRSGIAHERSREVSVWYAEQDLLARSEQEIAREGSERSEFARKMSREVSGRSGQYHMQSRICSHAEQEIARKRSGFWGSRGVSGRSGPYYMVCRAGTNKLLARDRKRLGLLGL